MALNPIERKNRALDLVGSVIIFNRYDLLERVFNLILEKYHFEKFNEEFMVEEFIRNSVSPTRIISGMIDWGKDSVFWMKTTERWASDFTTLQGTETVLQAIPKILDNTLLGAIPLVGRTKGIVTLYNIIKKVIHENIPEQERVYVPYPD